jgi:hypothetical protein
MACLITVHCSLIIINSAQRANAKQARGVAAIILGAAAWVVKLFNVKRSAAMDYATEERTLWNIGFCF